MSSSNDQIVTKEIIVREISGKSSVSAPAGNGHHAGNSSEVNTLLPGLFIFPGIFAWAELMFHLYRFQVLGWGALFGLLFAVAYGILAFTLTSLGSRKVNIIITWVISIPVFINFGLQTVYSHIFKVFIGLYSITQNAGDATEFWEEALNGIVACIPAIVLCVVIPVIVLAFSIKKGYLAADIRADNVSLNKGFLSHIPAFLRKRPIITGVSGIIVYVFCVFLLRSAGTDIYTPYDLYHNEYLLDMSIEKLGVMTSSTLDLNEFLFGSFRKQDYNITASDNLASLIPIEENRFDDSSSEVTGSDSNKDALEVPQVQSEDDSVNTNPDTNSDFGSDPGAESEINPEADSETVPASDVNPLPVIDTSPNVLDIDFAALAQTETNKDISELHTYFAGVEPTAKNEYTGMFEGYNFIYLCCEGFSPWAVDRELTPTLYRLTHSGFVFNNFYNPLWYTSTSDGEYVECIGLLPYSTNSFKRSKGNSLPFCFGWQFLRKGYTARAYHAHTATYYGRNETHPNMGYIFKAKNQGLPITDVWPESDLEMMKLSIPEYINDEHFHVYYMTVSGHLEYTFSGNTQAYRHRDDVAGLPYSNNCKAYIACNMELDLALEYLIEQLDSAGKLENTVIAFGADHYPYGLTADEINELAGENVEQNFELYHNYFVLWNSEMTEPVTVDKYCSSLDMMPTLSNLFGLDYDSRLFMGSDIFSDAPALVIFANQSFITDYCKYNSVTGKVEMLRDYELPEGYIASVSGIVKKKFAVSKSILLNDYFRYLPDCLENVEIPEASPN